MRIAILCGAGIGYPNGTAPTSRVSAYSHGLVECGDQVRVLCLGTSESAETGVLNREVRGTDCGVEFEYTCGTTLRPESFLKRRWLALRGLCVAAWKLVARRRRWAADVLILYPDSLARAVLFWLVAKATGAVYVLEKSERPFATEMNSFGWRLYARIYSRIVYRLFDGILVISDHLRDYFAQRVSPHTKILKIPVLVDVCRFALGDGMSGSAPRRVTYCGILNEAKDGVLTLMEAFSNLSGEFPDLRLVLLGDSYTRTCIPAFRQRAEDMGIAHRVDFVGLVPRTSIPDHLISASVLALARPPSLQAEAGLPTKVGEYLASARPVVVTKTGELDHYLEDGVSVFFAPAGDATAFAERVRYVLLHPEEAHAVGLRGRHVAEKHFDYRENAKRLHFFLEQLTYAVRTTETHS